MASVPGKQMLRSCVSKKVPVSLQSLKWLFALKTQFSFTFQSVQLFSCCKHGKDILQLSVSLS